MTYPGVQPPTVPGQPNQYWPPPRGVLAARRDVADVVDDAPGALIAAPSRSSQHGMLSLGLTEVVGTLIRSALWTGEPGRGEQRPGGGHGRPR